MAKNVTAEVAFPILLPVKEQSQLREKKKGKAVFSEKHIYSEIYIPLVMILILQKVKHKKIYLHFPVFHLSPLLPFY